MNAKKISSKTSVGLVSPQSSASACYIYGIANLGKQIVLSSRAIGPPFSKVYTIQYKDLSAIVSKSQYEEYDPTDDNVLIHNEALLEVKKKFNCTVVPLRFSTVAKSENDVQKILSNGYLKFKQKIALLQGKAEMVVKVYCDIGAFKNKIAKEEKLSSQKEIDAALQKKTADLAAILLERLKILSSKHVLNDLVFDDMILNGAFLIEEKTLENFLSCINNFDAKHGSGLKIEWSGPYPAYSFAEPPT